MSACPKCNKKISILYMKQNCPHCNVNLRFYNFEENFYRDAKKAELSLAKINIFLAHIKASLIGTRLTVIRLCVMLLPIVTLLIPYGKVTITQPFFTADISISVLGLYDAYGNNYLPYLLTMLTSSVNGKTYLLIAACIIAFILSVLMAFVIFFLTVLCFLCIKKMHKVLAVSGIIGAVFSVAATVLAAVFSNASQSSSMLSGTVTPACIATVICFGIVVAVNVLIGKQGLNIVYKEGDLERIEIAKKVKAGEISIDDLPQPIIETAETEEINKKIEEQQALYRNMKEGDSDGR